MKQIMKRNRKHEFTLKNRFLYWFDNRMSKNSLGLIRVLIAATVLLGWLDEKKNSVFHPPPGGQVTLTPESELIVLGEYT